MPSRWITACCGSFIFLTVIVAHGQSTISSVQPRSCRPGATTQLTITGENLNRRLRFTTSCDLAEVNLSSVEPGRAMLEVTLAEDAPLGPLGLWAATEEGPTEPFALLVDDLPTVNETGNNHSPSSAQTVEPFTAIDGISDGNKSDFYRFEATAGQRLAFEVLTQPLRSAMDPVVRLLDEDGETLVLADDDEVGPDCRFSHRFARSGSYLIEVRDNRYRAGDAYHLRIGDFPILRHAYPPTVPVGERTTVRFAGDDAEAVEGREISFATVGSQTIATRFPDGQSSAWVPIRINNLPSFKERQPVRDAESNKRDQSLSFPVTISGQLAQPRERDTYFIHGVTGARVRFQSYTRSLGCASLLQLRLFDPQGKQVAETAVSQSDEWSFEYTFPDDAIYRLEARDLLSRGGAGFGYSIEVFPAGTFAVNVKPDAKARQRFAIEPEHGGCAIELQVQRFGYDGPIDLSLSDPQCGIRIVNPRIPTGAKEARIYLAAADGWTTQSLAAVGIRAQASGDPAVACNVSSLAWQRVTYPHVPFPAGWGDGTVLLGGIDGSDPFFTLGPVKPVRLARALTRHDIAFRLERLDKAFKGSVTLLADALPADWTMSVKADKDTYATTFTRGDAVSEPQQLRMLCFAEHEGRGRLEAVDVPLEWFDPLETQLTVSEPLIAGGTYELVVQIERRGDDSQPVKLTIDLPAGFSPLETTTIPADENQAVFNVEIAADASSGEGVVTLTASSSYRGQEYTIETVSPPLPIIPKPASLEVYPKHIELHDERDRRQLVVTAYGEPRTARDWTRDARLTSANDQVAEVRGSTVVPIADGETEIIVQVGPLRKTIPVTVTMADGPRRTGFESEVLVALSKQGCNSGACHGSPSGKGMFRLSLRAFDRELDALTLIREDFGRRVNKIEPDQSLLLLKPLMKVSHGGGKRLRKQDAAYTILHDWIAEGARDDPADTPRCVQLEVYPNQKRVLRLSGGPQQLAAVAHFSDGSSRDVTHLVAYESANIDVASVDHRGLVTPAARGETVILVRYLEHIESVPLMFTEQVPGFVWQAPPANNYVDKLVNAKLQQIQYLPSPTCTDAEFLRRVYLDVIGILPSVAETRRFLEDSRPDKRALLIDDLLKREEFAKFWALKWGDLLRMTQAQVGDAGIYKYHRWVKEAFLANMPYDKFARQLVTASGSTLANPPANFYRTATDMNTCVETVSQVFLGARLACAKCHNHPFERWTQDNYYGLGAFFNRVQRRDTQRPGEMFIWTSDSGEVTQPRTGEQMKPWLPGEEDVAMAKNADRRIAFTDWLVDPDNPYFAKMEVNRIWAQLFARGIVDPIDDFRDSNPPTNEALLEALAKDFVDHAFDRRHLLRVILNSRTYQASYQTGPLNRDDTLYFSHQQPRLLSAEQLFDAIDQTLGLESQIGKLPAGSKATHLPAPDLVEIDFLEVFGQPQRSTVCACERTDASNLGMAIELFNGPLILEKLRDPKNRFRQAVAAGRPVKDVVDELYVAGLCRHPSANELQAAIDHCEERGDIAAGLEDICWALLNTDEFLFQH